MKNQVNIALMGFGVVGTGTLQLLRDHRRDIEARVGAPINVRWVVSRHPKKSPLLPKTTRQSTDWRAVIQDPEVDCVVELIGGSDVARQIVVAALRSNKHVVTANKALLAKYWNEVFGIAHERRKLVYFEGAVGGGVPMVQALNEGLAANEINKIIGILNGTTNFILTKMQETGMPFAEALKEAQAAGFAEADPSFDIEGIDAAQKISILGSLASGQWIPPHRVYCEGISKLELIDMRLVQARLNSTVKLLGIGEKTPAGWMFRVHPTLVPKTHPFANVRNENNAISFHGNAVGDIMLYGKGAGRLPTSSAVVSDLIFLCRQIANGTAGQLPYVSALDHKTVKLVDISHIQTRYYLRLTAADQPGVLARVAGILGKNKVSLASVHQDTLEEPAAKKGVSIVLVTHVSREADVQASVKAIDRLSSTRSRTVLLRMEL